MKAGGIMEANGVKKVTQSYHYFIIMYHRFHKKLRTILHDKTWRFVLTKIFKSYEKFNNQIVHFLRSSLHFNQTYQVRIKV